MTPSVNVPLRILGIAVAVQIAAATSAWACDGQVGKVIFEDSFADSLGGWDLGTGPASIKPPEMLFSVDKKNTGWSVHNLTFFATDGDYCLEAIVPPGKGVGIEFFATDYDNFLTAELAADSSLWMSNKVSGKWTDLFHVTPVAAFKAGPNDVNALRVTEKNGLVTIYVNGSQTKAIRVQVPDVKTQFGVYGEFLDRSKATDDSPPIRVKSFKVTTGESSGG